MTPTEPLRVGQGWTEKEVITKTYLSGVALVPPDGACWRLWGITTCLDPTPCTYRVLVTAVWVRYQEDVDCWEHS